MLLQAGRHFCIQHHQSNRKLARNVCTFVARPHSCLLFVTLISAKHTMICSGCPFLLSTSISLFAVTIRPVLPTGHKNVSYSQPFTTVNNWSLACNVRALIAQPHVYVCLFNWPNVLTALDTAPPSSLDHLNVLIQLADCNLPCCSTNKYQPDQCVQQLICCSDSFPLLSYVNGNDRGCLHIPSIHTLLS